MKHFYKTAKASLCMSFACLSLALNAQNPANYEVSVKINIEQGDAGVCFASPDNNNFVLFQFKSGKNFMRPHSRVNNNWVEYHDARYPDEFKIEAGKDYNVRIAVTEDGKKATTYIAEAGGAEIKAYELQDDRYNFAYGRVGVRQSYDGAIDDCAYFDDFKVTADDKVLYSEDFSDPDNCTISIPETFEIRDGRLFADGHQSEYFGWQIMKADESKNFKVECDFEINSVAAGIIWNAYDESNFHMWQFNVERNPSQFRPHVWVNGGASANDINVDIVPNHVYHLLIDVVNGGKRAVTYLDGNKIDERDGEFDANGKLGIRASYAENEVNGMRPSEKAWYDNFRVTDNDGNVLFSENFDNPRAVYFSDGEIDNGRLLITGPSDNELRVWQTESANSFVTGINDIISDKSADTVTIYNIQGMPVVVNAAPAAIDVLPAGLYIVNGKKVVVRK